MSISKLRPFFDNDDIENILEKICDILNGNSYLTMGKYGEQFEEEFAKYNGNTYAVACNSGTSALEIICRSLDLSGYEVIIPSNTFIATANAIFGAGAKPVFADIGYDMSLDPKSVLENITKRTKAIMTVHIGGYVSPTIYELQEICNTRNLFLIEDAAQAHGTSLDGQKAGTFGIAAGFSFFPTKIITCGEGGIIVTNDEKIYEKSGSIRQFGKVSRGIYQNYSEYLGYNWRLPEISALLGIFQLKKITTFIKRRKEIGKQYTKHLTDIDGIDLFEIANNVDFNYFKYILFLNNRNRSELHLKLKNKFRIELSGYVYEIPLHKQPVLKIYANGDYPISNALCESHICLPLYYNLKDSDLVYIIDSLKESLSDKF